MVQSSQCRMLHKFLPRLCLVADVSARELRTTKKKFADTASWYHVIVLVHQNTQSIFEWQANIMCLDLVAVWRNFAHRQGQGRFSWPVNVDDATPLLRPFICHNL